MISKISVLNNIDLEGDRLRTVTIALVVNMVAKLPLIEHSDNNVITDYLNKVHPTAVSVLKQVSKFFPIDVELAFRNMPKLYKARHEIETTERVKEQIFKGTTTTLHELQLRSTGCEESLDYILKISEKIDESLAGLDNIVSSIVDELLSQG